MAAKKCSQDPLGPSGQALESMDGTQEASGLVQIDPTANAALAQAVMSAKEGLKPADPSSNTVSDAPRQAATRRYPLMLQAACALALIGAGWFASYAGTLANREAIQRIEAETARSQEILTRLGEDLETLKGTLAAFKETTQTSSVSSASDQAQLADRVERLAIAIQNPDPKLASLETRLDRMESQIMTTLAGLTTKPAPIPAPAPAAPSDEAAISPVKAEPISGWILREVYDGAALIEGQNRRLYEVTPGSVIPGLGRIEAIERRSGRWVVLTDKGTIGAYR